MFMGHVIFHFPSSFPSIDVPFELSEHVYIYHSISPICSMVLVYKHLHDWVMLFGQMLVCIFHNYMEHMVK